MTHPTPSALRPHRGRVVILASLACLVVARAQGPAPHIGYVYPAGGQRGTTLTVAVGGQYLRGTEAVHISGQGATAAVVQYAWPMDDNDLRYARHAIRNLVKRRWSPAAVGESARPGEDTERVPDHPWLYDLDDKSPAQIARLKATLFDEKKQPNAQIGEQVELHVTIAADAAPGDRELRLVTPAGLSNPVRFRVGVLPELCEQDEIGSARPDAPPADLPVTLNGQIMPGETDAFVLRGREGQELVFRLQARHLTPYLADAVPGWFQAIMILYDATGAEVAYADDFRFDPDPVLHYEVPRDGEYRLEVRDSIYRGREDFVYRITAGELPFITEAFPLGGRAGEPASLSIAGWNLPTQELRLDTDPAGAPLRAVGLEGGEASNEVLYCVDTLPECVEQEPNDEQAQPVLVPGIINGRIDRPGDVDLFSFGGRAGEELVAEVYARRLHSPADCALRVSDSAGKVLGQGDDHDDRTFALVTHQADPYLRLILPADDTYTVRVVDAQRQGGSANAYRLHLRPPQPDFSLRATPCSLSMPGRRPAKLTVHALRKDGFAGAIDLRLRQAPEGFTLSTTTIAPGKDSVEITLSGPRDVPFGVYPLRLEGLARIEGLEVIRPVVPAEEMMQAFAYWHLVPQEELLVAVTGSRSVPVVWKPVVEGISWGEDAPIRVPLGGTVNLRLQAAETLPNGDHTPLSDVSFGLAAGPRGVTLREASPMPGGVALILKADGVIAREGDTAHLIVEAFVPEGEGPEANKKRVSLGVLPAIGCAVGKGGPIEAARAPATMVEDDGVGG